MPIEFREVLKFPKQRKECFANEGDFEQFCTELAANPLLESEVPGAGGARKIRWSDKKRGKGKSGGLRIYYYYNERFEVIFLMAVYNKNVVDLTPHERRDVAELIIELDAELEAETKTDTESIQESVFQEILPVLQSGED